MFQRLLFLWLCLLVGLAYLWPTFPATAFDPFTFSAPYLNYLFAVTMFAIGSLLPTEEITLVAKRWPTIIGGTACQYTIMPFLAWSLAWLFGLNETARIGIILVGCVPGAMASNVLTLIARGNISYSVSITTCSTLLSPLVVPFALWLTLGKSVDLSFVNMSLQLAWMVVGPIIFGHLLSRHSSSWHRLAHSIGPIIANLTILWIISVVVAENRGQLGHLTPALLGALLLLNLLGYAGGYGGALLMRLPEPMRRALTLEVGMQNAGLGSVMAMSFFHDAPATAIAPAFYTFGCMFTGTLLARLWAEFAPKEA